MCYLVQETKSVTLTQRSYRRKHHKATPSRNSILWWVQNFQYRGTVGIQSRSGRFSMTSEYKWRVFSYFNWRPRTSLRIVERCLGFQEDPFNKFFETDLTCIHTRFTSCRSLKKVIMKPAVSLPLNAYKLLNRIYPFSIVAFFTTNLSFTWI